MIDSGYIKTKRGNVFQLSMGKCEVISNIGEMDGHVHECIQKIRAKCLEHSGKRSIPVVRLFKVPK